MSPVRSRISTAIRMYSWYSTRIYGTLTRDFWPLLSSMLQQKTIVSADQSKASSSDSRKWLKHCQIWEMDQWCEVVPLLFDIISIILIMRKITYHHILSHSIIFNYWCCCWHSHILNHSSPMLVSRWLVSPYTCGCLFFCHSMSPW